MTYFNDITRMTYAEHVARKGEGREDVHTGFWWKTLRKRDYLEDPGVDERIISKWISQGVAWGT